MTWHSCLVVASILLMAPYCHSQELSVAEVVSNLHKVTKYKLTNSEQPMTHAHKTLVGPRRFQWNAGGWFGSSLGSSAWMLIVACFLEFHNQVTLALVPALGFVIVLSVSIWLWAGRARIYPFSALMILLGLIAFVLPVVWGIVSSNASEAALTAMNWPRTIWAFMAVSAMAPTLMFWFYFLERKTEPHHRSPATHNRMDTI